MWIAWVRIVSNNRLRDSCCWGLMLYNQRQHIHKWGLCGLHGSGQYEITNFGINIVGAQCYTIRDNTKMELCGLHGSGQYQITSFGISIVGAQCYIIRELSSMPVYRFCKWGIDRTGSRFCPVAGLRLAVWSHCSVLSESQTPLRKMGYRGKLYNFILLNM